MRYHRYTEIQEILKALTLMITVNTPDIIIDLSTERVIDVRVISFLLILPVSCSHFGKCLSLEFFRYGFIFGFDRYMIDVLVDTVQKLLHELVGVFLLPVNEKHAHFSCIELGVHTDFFRGKVEISTASLFFTTSTNKALYISTTSLLFPFLTAAYFPLTK